MEVVKYCRDYHIYGVCKRRACTQKHSFLHWVAFSELPVELVSEHVDHHLNKTNDESCFLCWLEPTRWKEVNNTFARCPSLITNEYKCPGPQFCQRQHNSIWDAKEASYIDNRLVALIRLFTIQTGFIIQQFMYFYTLDMLWNLNILENDGVDRLTELPDELILKIFTYVAYGDKEQLCMFKKVCKRFKCIANDWTLWKPITVPKTSLLLHKISVVNHFFNIGEKKFALNIRPENKYDLLRTVKYRDIFSFKKRYSKELTLWRQKRNDLRQKAPFKPGDIVYKKEDIYGGIDTTEDLTEVQRYIVKSVLIISSMENYSLHLTMKISEYQSRSPSSERICPEKLISEDAGSVFYYHAKNVAESCGWHTKSPQIRFELDKDKIEVEEIYYN